MRSLTAIIICACLLLTAVALVRGPPTPQDELDDRAVTRILGETTNPVAIISPMPDIISNGTYYLLAGNQSYDMDDDLVNRSNTLANHTWEITFEGKVTYLYGAIDQYWFREQGLYKIKLTVTDLWGNKGVDFTAVISVDDSDFDGLPDWWEMAYFDTLEHGPSDDPDDDGYTNLQEYADGTNPVVWDPAPARKGFVEENWQYILIAAIVAAGAAAASYPVMRKRRKKRDRQKMKYAIELEKSLDEE